MSESFERVLATGINFPKTFELVESARKLMQVGVQIRMQVKTCVVLHQLAFSFERGLNDHI